MLIAAEALVQVRQDGGEVVHLFEAVAQQGEADAVADQTAPRRGAIEAGREQRPDDGEGTVELAEVEAAVHGAAAGIILDPVYEFAVLDAFGAQGHSGADRGAEGVDAGLVHTELRRRDEGDGQTGHLRADEFVDGADVADETDLSPATTIVAAFPAVAAAWMPGA